MLIARKWSALILINNFLLCLCMRNKVLSYFSENFHTGFVNKMVDILQHMFCVFILYSPKLHCVAISLLTDLTPAIHTGPRSPGLYLSLLNCKLLIYGVQHTIWRWYKTYFCLCSIRLWDCYGLSGTCHIAFGNKLMGVQKFAWVRF